MLGTLGLTRPRATSSSPSGATSASRPRRTTSRCRAGSTSRSSRRPATSSTSSGGPGTDAGYRDDGAPGPRPQYSPDYYGAFLLDPDGNSVEAVHHGADREPVRSTTSGSASPTSTGPSGSTRRSRRTRGSALKRAAQDRVQVSGDRGSFSLVDGRPDRARAHRVPGCRRRDGRRLPPRARGRRLPRQRRPGERPEYHPGYYGAFVARSRRQQRRARQPQPALSRRSRWISRPTTAYT